jgi:hypothetical protein
MGEEMAAALNNFDGACRRKATFRVNLMRFAGQSMTDWHATDVSKHGFVSLSRLVERYRITPQPTLE